MFASETVASVEDGETSWCYRYPAGNCYAWFNRTTIHCDVVPTHMTDNSPSQLPRSTESSPSEVPSSIRGFGHTTYHPYRATETTFQTLTNRLQEPLRPAPSRAHYMISYSSLRIPAWRADSYLHCHLTRDNGDAPFHYQGPPTPYMEPAPTTVPRIRAQSGESNHVPSFPGLFPNATPLKVLPMALSPSPQGEVVDLFCGVGALSHGLHLAGFEILAGYDLDPRCKYAFETNNRAAFFTRDVATLTPKEIRNHYSGNSLSILAGCAPCQPFSTYKRRYAEDPRWSLVSVFGELAASVLPDIVTMENVPALLNYKRGEVFQAFCQQLEEAHYCSVANKTVCISPNGVTLPGVGMREGNRCAWRQESCCRSKSRGHWRSGHRRAARRCACARERALC